MPEEYDIELSEEKLAEHLFSSLTMLGYTIKQEEVDDIAAIVFDYVMDLFNGEWEWDE